MKGDEENGGVLVYPRAGGARSSRRRRLARTGPETLRTNVWMLAIMGVALVLGHLVLVQRHQTSAQLGITLICWYAVGILVAGKGRRLELSSSPGASVVGLVVLGLTWSNGLWMNEARESFLFLYPLVGGLGLALLASGFGGWRQYWRELMILFFLGIPRGFISEWVDLSVMTANVAGFVLWYLGYDVQLAGTEIGLPGGTVQVDKGCDGTGVISYLVSLAVVFVCLFPVGRGRAILALVVAPLLAFVTNMMRVLTLALMEAAGQHDAFEYWHTGSGSITWTVLPVVLFGLAGLALLPKGRLREKPGGLIVA